MRAKLSTARALIRCERTLHHIRCLASSPGILAEGRPELYAEINYGYQLITGAGFDGVSLDEGESEEEYVCLPRARYLAAAVQFDSG
jgi:hypothetical protein